MKASLKAKPAATAPSESTASGISIGERALMRGVVMTMARDDRHGHDHHGRDAA
jgi:hypothetical protein